MDNYNKLFMIIRKTDLLYEDEKHELKLYLMNLQNQVQKQKEVIDKAIELLNNFNFKILIDNRTMYIRLKDLEQGKDLLKLLEEVSDE